MAPIPLTNRIHTTTQHVPTTNLGSALANSDRAAYTIQELADTITLGTYLPLAGGSMSGDIVMGGNQIKFADAGRLYIGDSNDLQIYHDGANSYLDNTTGDLYIKNTFQDRDIILQSDNGSGGDAAYIQIDGSTGVVELSHYGAKKIETTATGVRITGQVDLTALNTAPSSATDTGTVGEIRVTADYIYVCSATDTWVRTALITW